MRRPNRRPNYTETEDITNWEIPPDYLIYKDDADTVAVNGSTGEEDSRNTDSSTVIQYAIDQITSGKGIIQCKGSFTLAAEIILDDNITLQGGTFTRGIGLTTNMFNIDDKSYVTLQNMEIDGDSKNCDYGITVHYSTQLRLFNLTIKDFDKSGIYLDGTGGLCAFERGVQIDHVHVTGCDSVDGTGLLLDIARYDYHVITNSTFGYNYTGVYLHFGSNIYFDNCKFNGNDHYGICVADRTYMNNCSANHNGEIGVFFHSSTDCAIDNSDVMRNENEGIAAYLTSNIAIRNSYIASNGQTGETDHDSEIRLNQAINTCVSNCYLGFQGYAILYGIYIFAGCYDTILNDNHIETATTPINDLGSRTMVNHTATESANAETPQLAWPTGTIVDFTDSGDASGDGVYILAKDGNWMQLA